MALPILGLPRRLGAAGTNLSDKLHRRPIADLRALPRDIVERRTSYTLYRYNAVPGTAVRGRPVLLVPPLAAPALAFDLRRGCSVVEYFVQRGRPVYLVDYGPVSFAHRGLGIEHWVDSVVPSAVETTAEHSGADGVHLAGWSLGGIFTMFTAAAHPDLPLASATAVASPFDLRRVPLLALARPVDRIAGALVGPAYRAMGGVPAPLTRLGFQLSSLDKYVTKPLAMLTHADDRDFLAQLEAVDRFMGEMYAYPGRTFGQLYHVVMRSNEFATGTMELAGRIVELAKIDVPVLVVAGTGDTLAPLPAVRHLIDLVTGSPDAQLVQAPGGHLGVLTGRAARRTTWPAMEKFFVKHDD
ncbi:alpha/beta hydrolase [Aeromicrobium chenweiae]|uniref:Alpha/beta hydrolase n=1 Tax=Aeromicrobium chenweiae TaxID=2079793 RepID=A0A2S0WI90_9ACTN|nr:alpha/beta hydrolase [Aeromicrobium chenweiae]AWB91059.1 alpha/beta hydrolase [Aeromicrobium chenweiae]TGN31962.1 alpha/beta hydrolase [Aeromicrobium chenweiae]